MSFTSTDPSSQRSAVRLQLVQDSLDVLIPATTLGYTRLDEGTVGLAGCVAPPIWPFADGPFVSSPRCSVCVRSAPRSWVRRRSDCRGRARTALRMSTNLLCVALDSVHRYPFLSMKRARPSPGGAGVDVERLLKKLKASDGKPAPTKPKASKPAKPTRVVDAPAPRGKAAASLKSAKGARPAHKTGGTSAPKPARPASGSGSAPPPPRADQPRTAPSRSAASSASIAAPVLGSGSGLGALQSSLRSKLGGSRFRWINEKLVRLDMTCAHTSHLVVHADGLRSRRDDGRGSDSL